MWTRIKRRTKIGALVVMALLPSGIKIILYRSLFGAKIGRGVYIGASYINAQQIEIGDKVQIGHLNFINKLDEFFAGNGSKIQNLNRITGVSGSRGNYYSECGSGYSAVELGVGAAITSRHFIDCAEKVTIGCNTVVAGIGTQIWTHGLNPRTRQQETAPVTIGQDCIVGSRCLILKGSVLPDSSVLGAGSTLTKKYTERGHVYAGSPAKIVKSAASTADPHG